MSDRDKCSTDASLVRWLAPPIGVLGLIVVALIAFGLATQKPRAPNVRIGRPAIQAPQITYVCSYTGELAILATARDGTPIDPIPTRERCDYEAYRAARDGSEEIEPPQKIAPPANGGEQRASDVV